VTDYHPDHRYTGTLVQDAAYMVTVPFFVSSVPALNRNPIFLYFEDTFKRPAPFRPDIAISIDDVFEKKMYALEAHVSQMFEWTPFMLSRSTGRPEPIPTDPAERRAWLANIWFPHQPSPDVQACLDALNGVSTTPVRYAEAFEICEYGRQIDSTEMRRLFPFLSHGGGSQV
jgi:LmbE family N-acetylglucosaminyl deacetylase